MIGSIKSDTSSYTVYLCYLEYNLVVIIVEIIFL